MTVAGLGHIFFLPNPSQFITNSKIILLPTAMQPDILPAS